MNAHRIADPDAVELLRAMLAVPSPSGYEANLAGHLRRAMAAAGLRAHVDSVGNAVGVLDRGPGPTVMLLGHMDTVPGTVPVRFAGGRLYGRGAVDAKGPLAAMICAATRVAGFQGRLVVVGVVEEETPGSRGAMAIRVRHPRPDALIVGEPSGWSSVVVGYKGKLDLRYHVRCAPTHPASPEPKAVELAVDAWMALRAVLGGGSHLAFDQPGPTLTALSGDLTEVVAEFSVRTPAGFDVPGCLRELRGRLTGGTVEVVNAVGACQVRRTDPVVRALSRAIAAEGGTPRAKVKTATSDMNTLAEVWDVPMATYGPGDSGLDHRDDEHIVLDEYLAGIRVLETALADLSAALVAGDRLAVAAVG